MKLLQLPEHFEILGIPERSGIFELHEFLGILEVPGIFGIPETPEGKPSLGVEGLPLRTRLQEKLLSAQKRFGIDLLDRRRTNA